VIEVIAAGHVCLDILPAIEAASAVSESFLAPGRLVESGALRFTPGGCVSNTGLALHILGTDVRLVGRVGTDRVAALNRQVLCDYAPSLAADLTIADGAPGAYTIVISPPGIDRTFLAYTGPNDNFGPEDLPDTLLLETRLLHLGYPPLLRRMYADGGATLTELLSRGQACGATVSLDLSMPDPARPSGQADWPAILASALPHVDLFVPSVEELLFMLDRPGYQQLTARCGAAGMIDALSSATIEELASASLALGARVVLLKLGHRGVYLRTGDRQVLGRGAPLSATAWRQRQLWAPAYEVEVRGTVGAGDATIAGFLTAILRGQGPAQAANSAAAVGACNVEQADAASGLLPWEATQQRIAKGWRRKCCGIESVPGWHHDAELDIMCGPSDSAQPA